MEQTHVGKQQVMIKINEKMKNKQEMKKERGSPKSN